MTPSSKVPEKLPSGWPFGKCASSLTVSPCVVPSNFTLRDVPEIFPPVSWRVARRTIGSPNRMIVNSQVPLRFSAAPITGNTSTLTQAKSSVRHRGKCIATFLAMNLKPSIFSRFWRNCSRWAVRPPAACDAKRLSCKLLRQIVMGKPQRKYNQSMARGWESKSVEAQIESAAEKDTPNRSVGRSAAEVDQMRQKENLVLSRTRVMHDLENSANPRYRQILQKALADLDAKISRFEPARGVAAA